MDRASNVQGLDGGYEKKESLEFFVINLVTRGWFFVGVTFKVIQSTSDCTISLLIKHDSYEDFFETRV